MLRKMLLLIVDGSFLSFAPAPFSFTPLLHKADNNRARESSNPTGEPFTAAGHTANRLVDAPTLDWAAQESNRNAAMRDSLWCRSDGQHRASLPGHGRESSQHAALLLVQGSCLSSRLLTALLTLQSSSMVGVCPSLSDQEGSHQGFLVRSKGPEKDHQEEAPKTGFRGQSLSPAARPLNSPTPNSGETQWALLT